MNDDKIGGFRLRRIFSLDTVALDYCGLGGLGTQIFWRCRVRRDWRCPITGRTIESGSIAFRPISGRLGRHRISPEGIAALFVRRIKYGED